LKRQICIFAAEWRPEAVRRDGAEACPKCFALSVLYRDNGLMILESLFIHLSLWAVPLFAKQKTMAIPQTRIDTILIFYY
jgi:hypothetical protein